MSISNLHMEHQIEASVLVLKLDAFIKLNNFKISININVQVI